MDVYGYLDSDVVTKEFGRKEFLLRDETGAVYTSYYEIDSPMPPIRPRTWLKVSVVWRWWGLQAVRVVEPETNFMDTLEQKARQSARAIQEKIHLSAIF